MLDLQGKVVLITGASSGIGAAAAIYFSSFGAKLSLAGRNHANLCKTIENCSKDHFIICGDLLDENYRKKLIEDTVNYFGRLDILVNSAGILEFGSIENTSLEQFDKVFNINVRAIYDLTKLAVPHLSHTKGCIVNVSSINGMRSFTGILAYNMSKAALDQFTKCVALELAPKGIRVNSVNPGVIITDIHKRAGLSEDEYQKFLEKSKTTHALGRPGTVEEVAKAIAFLASNESSGFITGICLPIDGGRHLVCPR